MDNHDIPYGVGCAVLVIRRRIKRVDRDRASDIAHHSQQIDNAAIHNRICCDCRTSAAPDKHKRHRLTKIASNLRSVCNQNRIVWNVSQIRRYRSSLIIEVDFRTGFIRSNLLHERGVVRLRKRLRESAAERDICHASCTTAALPIPINKRLHSIRQRGIRFPGLGIGSSEQGLNLLKDCQVITPLPSSVLTPASSAPISCKAPSTVSVVKYPPVSVMAFVWSGAITV